MPDRFLAQVENMDPFKKHSGFARVRAGPASLSSAKARPRFRAAPKTFFPQVVSSTLYPP
jgi:hypothetical protein